jgi:hypothetical protein
MWAEINRAPGSRVNEFFRVVKPAFLLNLQISGEGHLISDFLLPDWTSWTAA